MAGPPRGRRPFSRLKLLPLLEERAILVRRRPLPVGGWAKKEGLGRDFCGSGGLVSSPESRPGLSSCLSVLLLLLPCYRPSAGHGLAATRRWSPVPRPAVRPSIAICANFGDVLQLGREKEARFGQSGHSEHRGRLLEAAACVTLVLIVSGYSGQR